MRLANQYRRQFGWRDWPGILGALPCVAGSTVLDLGCGIGDLSAELVRLGATVIGIDASEELIREARSRSLQRAASFVVQDLAEELRVDVQAHGIWCSFTAAYFPDLSRALTRWAKHLRPGGWIAITEIDDLFGHVPVEPETKALLDAYVDEALATDRYDFRMGRKLEDHLRRTGFRISESLTLSDRELSFNGPALPEVLDSWEDRFGRMEQLRRFCGESYSRVKDDVLMCLAREDHRSLATVRCSIGWKPSVTSFIPASSS